ncbi:MAG: phage holin family protein [Clostridia bacterium]|jgi:hypothetical protein
MDLFNYIKEYIRPELLILAIVLYFLGVAIKNTEVIKDKYIPLVLGLVGIIFSAIYVVATSTIASYQDILTIIFTSIVQGILVAGASVYVNQLIKQNNKEE